MFFPVISFFIQLFYNSCLEFNNVNVNVNVYFIIAIFINNFEMMLILDKKNEILNGFQLTSFGCFFMELNEELARKLVGGLQIMKNKYESLKNNRRNLKSAIMTINNDIQELSKQFQILSRVYPLESQKTLHNNVLCKYKLKKAKKNQQNDLNQINYIQEVYEKTLVHLDLEKQKYKKARDKKHLVAEDLSQISEIVQQLRLKPTKEAIISDSENELYGINKQGEAEAHRILVSIQSLKREYDNIDQTQRDLQIKLATKIRNISECENQLAEQDETMDELNSYLIVLNNQIDKASLMYGEKANQKEVLQSNINSLLKSTHNNNEESVKYSKLIKIGRTKYQKTKYQIKQLLKSYEDLFNQESNNFQTGLNSKVQKIKSRVMSQKSEIETISNQIKQINLETEEIKRKQEQVEKDKERDKEMFEQQKHEAAERIKVLQSVITSLASKLFV